MALYKYVYYYYFFVNNFLLIPVLNSQEMKKYAIRNAKKYKNQAGMNLTPPPSQNSRAVRWHYRPIAESERRVAEIKS